MSSPCGSPLYTFATTIEQATSATGEFRAGGTDIQERLRSRVTTGPLIDIFGIEDLNGIAHSDGGTRIGALTSVCAVGSDKRLQHDYPALVLPAQTLATPQTRHSASMGGVLCQRTRCTYFRHPELGCPKKGNSDFCPSREGDHHVGVVFDLGPCVYPHPSSIGCALLTYDATLEVVGRDSLSVVDFFGSGEDVRRDNMLEPGELLTAIRLPPPRKGEKAAYFRQMSREWAEWPLVEVIVRMVIEDDVICDVGIAIGGVANIPLRLVDVEEKLMRGTTSDENLAAAAKLATARCNPLPGTRYKVAMLEASVLEALEQAVAYQGASK